MIIDSTVRLKQISNSEVSGYILNVIENYLTGNPFLPTGNATGLFYPLTGNPSGFVTSGALNSYITSTQSQTNINSAVTQTLAYVSTNYLSTGSSLAPTQLTGTFYPLYASVNQTNSNFNISNSYLIYLVDTTIQSITGTFPSATNYTGFQFVIKDWKGNAFTNNIILTGSFNQTLDGSFSTVINVNYMSLNIISDGNNWCLI